MGDRVLVLLHLEAGGTFDRLMDLPRGDLRQAHGCRRQPSAAIIDSQSVKTTEKGAPGYGAGK